MLALMARYWWVAVLRGVVAILFGLMAFAWPALTLATLILFFGAWALVTGIFLVIGALGGRAPDGEWWLPLLQGGLGIAVGLMTFAAPGVTEIALLLYIASWALASGVIEIVTAIRLRREIEGDGWLIASGLLSVLFALAIMASPGAGALALVWVIGGFALASGILLIAVGIKLHGMIPGGANSTGGSS